MAVAPTFSEDSELARWVPEIQRTAQNRPHLNVFLPNPGEDHLSVNSLEVESLVQIANYYKSELQKDKKETAVCVHKIARYNGASRKAGIQLRYNRSNGCWEYQSNSDWKVCYLHRAVKRAGARKASPSHSGVEYALIFDKIDSNRFARELAKKPRFHLL